MERIKDKVVLLAGATGGIGQKTAQLLQESGAKLFVTGRNADKLREVSEKLNLPEGRAFVMDIMSAASVQDVVRRVHEQVPAVDILINATGVGIIKPLETLSEEEFQLSLEVNLIGAFRLLKAFLPNMKEQKKGLIIHLPGVLGKSPMAGAMAYAASKYGLNGMMKSLREELKRTDIRVTQLYLGGVDSSFWDTIDLRVQRDKMIVAEEAARAIWFLCQQPSSGVVAEMVIQPFNHQVI